MEGLRPVGGDGAAVRCNQVDTDILGMVFLKRAGREDGTSARTGNTRTAHTRITHTGQLLPGQMISRTNGTCDNTYRKVEIIKCKIVFNEQPSMNPWTTD